jgi:hypothetical protein
VPDEQVQIHPAVTAERVDGGDILVHLETNEIFELNATGSRIFELLRAQKRRSEIAQALVDEFVIDGATAERKLDEFLAELRRRKILV